MLKTTSLHFVVGVILRAVRVGPDRALWLDEPFQAHPRSVDRAFASEEECIVQPASECAAEERSHHWNLVKLSVVVIQDLLPEQPTQK